MTSFILPAAEYTLTELKGTVDGVTIKYALILGVNVDEQAHHAISSTFTMYLDELRAQFNRLYNATDAESGSSSATTVKLTSWQENQVGLIVQVTLANRSGLDDEIAYTLEDEHEDRKILSNVVDEVSPEPEVDAPHDGLFNPATFGVPGALG